MSNFFICEVDLFSYLFFMFQMRILKDRVFQSNSLSRVLKYSFRREDTPPKAAQTVGRDRAPCELMGLQPQLHWGDLEPWARMTSEPSEEVKRNEENTIILSFNQA